MKGKKVMYSILDKEIQYIKGVGPKKADKMSRLGIFTIRDALYYFPRQFEDRSIEKQIMAITDGEKVTIKGRIKKISNKRINRLDITEITVEDETGIISLIFFNKSYLKNTYRVNDAIRSFGTVKKTEYGRLEMHNCEIEYERLIKNVGTIIPVYKLSNGVTNKDVMGVVRNIFDTSEVKIKEYLPMELVDKHRLCDINFAIKSMHFPTDKQSVQIAMYRLIFEELYFLQLGLFSIKGGNEIKSGINFNISGKIDKIIRELPFSLTRSQKKALDEILGDMNSNRVMNRLVQGDVGSGKTVVAQLSLANCVFNGYQGAYMAPTEILAKQHFESFSEFFAGSDVKIELLTSSTTKKNNMRILESLENGDIDILIGTHSLIEDKVKFNHLGLVITDEQHRFGVRQRGKLSSKAENPDVLVMTATPIPRTLALILYGDLDISVIDELPPGRKAIETLAIKKNARGKLYKNNIRKEIEKGHQVYVVCPLVDESEVLDVSSATEVYEELSHRYFPDLKVGILHGKMKNSEKDDIMEAFKRGDIDILVSTTVIEVGVNVPNATVMIIENAERFGLAQLHQLRGRVGRGKEQSFCVLIYDSNNEVALERMKTMESSNDGFVLAEKDLSIRGPGDFFGTRQHGLPELMVANLLKHSKMLKIAQKEARLTYANDPSLSEEKNRGVKDKVEYMFRDIGYNMSI